MIHRLFAILFLAAWGCCSTVCAAPVDGPYVVHDAQGNLAAWSVEEAADGLRKRVAPVAIGTTLTIAAVSGLPSFDVEIRPPAQPAGAAIRSAAKSPLFVVADTHGEFEILARMLIAQHVVDAALRWSFGRGHLVVLGDTVDRGPNQTEILWLLYALEAQARRAGGAVDLVLGNHEAMLMQGDLRYLNAKYLRTAAALDVNSYSSLFDARSVLGQWLRSKPAVLKLNDLLCLHGGISPALIERKLTLSDINSRVRAGLDGVPDEFLFGESGPLWYRGYFPAESGQPAPAAADIDRIRKHFGVDTILVGHTRVPTITPLYDARVIAVQVYPRRDNFGNAIFEALLIRDGKYFRALPDGRLEKL